MLDLVKSLLLTGKSLLKTKEELALENLALRQQLAVLSRDSKRAKLTKADRAFWVALKRLWPGWSDALVIVEPETVIGWHRKGFKLFWRWKSRKNKPGRPRISHLIRIFKEYIDSYHNPRRTHLGLDRDCPIPRAVDPPENGKVVSIPILGGLHHHYCRQAA